MSLNTIPNEDKLRQCYKQYAQGKTNLKNQADAVKNTITTIKAFSEYSTLATKAEQDVLTATETAVDALITAIS